MAAQRIIRPRSMTPDLLAVTLAVLLGCLLSGALGFILARE
jgi:hypothetical protein